MKWQKKLTKKELRHVVESGGRTLEGFKRNREGQMKMKEEHKIRFKDEGNHEPCFMCRGIAIKLGIEE